MHYIPKLRRINGRKRKGNENLALFVGEIRKGEEKETKEKTNNLQTVLK